MCECLTPCQKHVLFHYTVSPDFATSLSQLHINSSLSVWGLSRLCNIHKANTTSNFISLSFTRLLSPNSLALWKSKETMAGRGGNRSNSLSSHPAGLLYLCRARVKDLMKTMTTPTTAMNVLLEYLRWLRHGKSLLWQPTTAY